MSLTPAPRACGPSMRNGRFATVPSEKTVSMWPISRTRGPAPGAPSNVSDDRVAVAAFRVRPALDGRAEPPQLRRDQVADLVDPGGRIAPAIDIAHALEIGQECRQAALRRSLQRRELVGGDAGTRRRSRSSRPKYAR